MCTTRATQARADTWGAHMLSPRMMYSPSTACSTPLCERTPGRGVLGLEVVSERRGMRAMGTRNLDPHEALPPPTPVLCPKS
jgi:hypothetical protein